MLNNPVVLLWYVIMNNMMVVMHKMADIIIVISEWRPTYLWRLLDNHNMFIVICIF